MTLLAVFGGLLLSLAILVREYQLSRERGAQLAVVEQLRLNLEGTRTQLQRAFEDLYVLQSVLQEHHVVDDGELDRGRARLIEVPRRLEAEKNAIMRHFGVKPTHLVVEDTEGKVH